MSRLARDPASAAAFLAATIAFGAAGYGLLVHASADDATTDKVATAVGANSVFGLSDPGPAAELAADVGKSTVVLRTGPQDQRLHRRPPVRRGRGDVRRGRELVAAVLRPRGVRPGGAAARRTDLDAVPVLLAGDDAHVPATGTLARGDAFSVPYRVVDRIAGFAGSGPSQTVLVVDQDALLALAPPGAIDTLEVELWTCPGRRHRDPRGALRRARGLARGHL